MAAERRTPFLRAVVATIQGQFEEFVKVILSKDEEGMLPMQEAKSEVTEQKEQIQTLNRMVQSLTAAMAMRPTHMIAAIFRIYKSI